MPHEAECLFQIPNYTGFKRTVHALSRRQGFRHAEDKWDHCEKWSHSKRGPSSGLVLCMPSLVAARMEYCPWSIVPWADLYLWKTKAHPVFAGGPRRVFRFLEVPRLFWGQPQSGLAACRCGGVAGLAGKTFVLSGERLGRLMVQSAQDQARWQRWLCIPHSPSWTSRNAPEPIWAENPKLQLLGRNVHLLLR